MEKNDNSTPYLSSEYDAQVRLTIPYYELFHYETIELVMSIQANPTYWLDTGCGTGFTVEKALQCFQNTQFFLCDPSEKMLAIAKKRLNPAIHANVTILDPIASENLDQIQIPTQDVITSIQAHQYLSQEKRRTAVANCYQLLKPGGIFIFFENIRPDSEIGIQISMKRWMSFQIQQGRKAEAVLDHAKRFDQEYFPITLQEHLDLLRETGFRTAEVFRYSYMQAGFYAIK